MINFFYELKTFSFCVTKQAYIDSKKMEFLYFWSKCDLIFPILAKRLLLRPNITYWPSFFSFKQLENRRVLLSGIKKDNFFAIFQAKFNIYQHKFE